MAFCGIDLLDTDPKLDWKLFQHREIGSGKSAYLCAVGSEQSNKEDWVHLHHPEKFFKCNRATFVLWNAWFLPLVPKRIGMEDGARGRPPGRPAGTNTRIGMEDGARGRLPGRPAGTKKRKRTHNFHKTPSTTANGPRTKHNVSAESKQVRSLDGARGRPAGTNKRIGMEDGARGRRAGRKKRKRTDILPREIFHRLLILCVRHLWCHLPWNHICLVGIDECRTGHSSRKKLVVHKVLLVFV